MLGGAGGEAAREPPNRPPPQAAPLDIFLTLSENRMCDQTRRKRL